ncbi:MAG: biotin/lipoyl-binding protein [Bacteroidetes bacterium]|jgi:biotin carboxyl carrier protein|nr:biotin/lipoyl-binding protein [Bacteroidota bacterium]MDA0981180.1 biotin/lipoyl-binding protein [Bacteroidota bacterium]
MAKEIRFEDRIISVDSKNLLLGEWTRTSEGCYNVLIDGQSLNIEAIEGPDESGAMTVKVGGVLREVIVFDERALLLDKMGMNTGDSGADSQLCAPMPGKVLSVLVEAGQDVKVGDSLLILEAMKMENVIKSAVDGTIEDVNAKAGLAVEKGELLVAFKG